MKKRVYSSSDRAGIVQLDIKKQQKQQGYKHHSRCPLPKPSRPDSSANKQHLNNAETSLDIKIKELKTPILNQMKLLISNYISSSDRILLYIHPEEHKHSVNIYHQDRKKLLHYFNSLVVRPVDLGQVKARLNGGKAKPEIEESYYMNAKHELPTQQELGKEVETMKVQVEQAINRKRSKSSMAQFEKDMSAVKAKLHDLEKRKQASNKEQFSSFLKLCHKFKLDYQFKQNNPQSQHQLGLLRAQRDKESAKSQKLDEQVTNCRVQLQGVKTKFASIELLLFKCAQILNQSITLGNQANKVCSIEKSKIDQLVKALTETLNYMHPQTDASNDVMQKLKNEVQTMVISLRQLRKRQLQLLREKQKALEDLKQYKLQPRKEQCLNQDYKVHIQRLNNDIADLLQDIQRKDQLIQGLSQENTHIHQDLKSMQEHIEQTQKKYRNICIQLEEIVEKLKKYQSLLQGKDQQVEQLRLEIKNKNLLIKEKNNLISERQLTICKLQAFNIQAQSNQQNLNKHWLASKIEYQSRLKQREEKFIRLQQQMTQLQSRISQLKQENEKILVLKDSTEGKILNMQLRIQALQNQNYQLYSDVRQSQKLQEKLQQNNASYQLLYNQLQQQCDNYRQEIQQNHAKIRFYEQKVMQLAQLAAEQINFMHSHNQQDHSGPIVQLEEIKEIVKGQDESKEQQEDVMFNWNELPRSDTKSERSDEYFPFLLQNQIPSPKTSDHSKKSFPDLLKSANSRQIEHPGASTLSHYDILVINEYMDTIDTHKAVQSKNKQEIKNSDQQFVPLIPQKDAQPSSNLAESSQSHTLLPIKGIKSRDNKQEDIIQDIVSLKQNNQKKQLIDVQKQPKMVYYICQSRSLTQKHSRDKLQFKDCDNFQLNKANQIYKQQEQDLKTFKNNREQKRQRSCQNKGNIYIRLKRQGSQISTTNRDRYQRSRSCLDKQL